MSRQGIKPNRLTFPLLLKASISLSSLPLSTALHTQIFKFGFGADIVVVTALVDALCKCSDVGSARKVFDGMTGKDVAAWNAMLSGYCRNGYVDEVLLVFARMQSCGVEPNSLTLSILLQTSSSSDNGDWRRLGRCVHGYVFQRQANGGVGDVNDVFLYNSLLVFYNKSGNIEFAECLFERMSRRDVVSWNAMMSGYSRNGYAHEALRTFHRMQAEGFCPDLVTLETALQACAQAGDAIEDGRSIHKFMVECGFSLNIYAENSLLLMYCKCRDIDSAGYLFDGMRVRNLVSWNILIDGYVQNGQPQKALLLFKYTRMVERTVSSDLLVSALQALKLLGGHPEEHIMCIHCLVIVTGLDSNAFVTSSLVASYGEGGNVETALSCFNYSAYRRNRTNRVSWNTMLSVYVFNRCCNEAIELFRTMQFEAYECDAITLVNALLVCTQQSDMKQGKAIHAYIIRNQFEPNVVVTTALLELYLQCKLLNVACLLFSKMHRRNVVSWNTMIFGCCQNGFPGTSLNLFHHMLQQDNMAPDATTVVGVIEAISQRGFESEGKYIHDYAIHLNLDKDEFVVNSLIAMYAGFGNFDRASLVFDEVNKLSTVTWNAMISEYSRHGLPDKAIAVFHRMKIESVASDSITLLSILPACAHLASLSCGMWIHSIVCKTGYESDVFVGTALINMYAKCGDIKMARLVFERMGFKTTVSWNSMIWGYGMHGNAEEAEKLFLAMQLLGLDPDIVTFLVLISGCSHAGNVQKGRQYFDLMTREYSMSPRIEHFSSVVDLLSRNGLVQEAFEFIEKMPVAPHTCTWGPLLGACRVQRDIRAGLVAAEKVFELDPFHCGYHVLLANMYSESGRWADASMIRSKMRERGVGKQPGWSMVDYHI
ncbi:putative pentatricopeptide repeat-containing protein At3g11460, mitochondrial [Magnolia sinica]|uniref:putative pentatricopeptide repeat-containing protein At3g11460, mitochondrial n=1 Tax=Magnolia sinica TaxID=86752 RepID=UPI002657BBD0|nr:putative pentatricopeptide repeat-containing protein At3g11460, mitochondrial [Magnolia sinica]